MYLLAGIVQRKTCRYIAITQRADVSLPQHTAPIIIKFYYDQRYGITGYAHWKLVNVVTFQWSMLWHSSDNCISRAAELKQDSQYSITQITPDTILTGWLVDWYLTTISAQTGYICATGVRNTLCMAGGQDKHTIKQWNCPVIYTWHSGTHSLNWKSYKRSSATALWR